jgi:hypothetical protein
MTDGCYETDPLTRSLIGEKPTVLGVLAWSAGVSLLFEWARGSLPEGARAWLDRGGAMLKLYTVLSNHKAGIPLFGEVDCR